LDVRTWPNVAATIALVVGVVWILQGANLLKGSFMTGQSLWLYVGVAVVIVALGALWWINLRLG
jgi:hypothetical protein